MCDRYGLVANSDGRFELVHIDRVMNTYVVRIIVRILLVIKFLRGVNK